MTLYDRVQQAGNAKVDNGFSDADLLGRLRNRLQEDVSVDKLAKLAQSNPEQARNEVKSACRHIFSEPAWSYVGEAIQEQLLTKLLDTIFGFGILEDMLADESITEIIANGPAALFYEQGGVIHPAASHFADEAELRALIDRILGSLGRRIDEASPMVNARLPQGHRVNVVIPPVALDGPCVTIRKFSRHVITLEEMEQAGSLEPPVRKFLIWAVKARKSIAVSGGAGSGKTKPQHKRYRPQSGKS